MSLATRTGREKDVFSETSGYADRVHLIRRINVHDLKQLREFDPEHYYSEIIINISQKKA